MKAMILAAGLGTRLLPLTNTLPKPLLPVGDYPLIYYALFMLRHYGITQVVINLHHKGEMIRNRLEADHALGMNITFSKEENILGTGGGLKKAEWFLSDETFLVVNSDILMDLNLESLVSFHLNRGGIGTIVLRRDQEADRYGVIETDSTHRVRRFLGLPEEVEVALVPFMFTGVQVLEPAIFKKLPSGVFHSITDTYRELVLEGEGLYGCETKGYWMDLGTPERYEQVKNDFENGSIAFPFLPMG